MKRLHRAPRSKALKADSLVVTVLVLTTLAPGGRCEAQLVQADHDERWKSATWVDDLNFLGSNALLAGVTAAVASYLRDQPVARGFARGALGGAVGYAGKRLSVARFEGAGFLGREVGAVGASITRNASLQVGLLDTLVLPLGPVRAFVSPSAPGNVRLRVDLHETSWLAYGLLEERLRLNLGRTLSSGSAVFETDARIRSDDVFVDGSAAGGVIFLSRRTRQPAGDVFAHERVHVIQRDFLKMSAGYAVEDWGLRKLGLTRIPHTGHLLIGLAAGYLSYPLAGPWDRSGDLFEVEADFLEARR